MTPPTSIAAEVEVVQTNLQHKILAAAALRRLLEVKPNTIALIQEPWVRGNKICGLNNPGGKILFDASVASPRACIYMPTCIQASLLTQFCSRDLAVVRLPNSTEHAQTVVLASVYMPGEEAIPSKELADLTQHCFENSWELIISADSNAHHPLWGSHQANNRGEQLIEFLMSTNLLIMNKGNDPTFINSRHQTCIDITLVSVGASELATNWHLSDEPSFSDHRRISYAIQTQTQPPQPWRNPRKTDITKFKDVLSHKLTAGHFKDASISTTNIEHNVNIITNCLQDTYHQSCPLTNPKSPADGHWWGKDLERTRRKARQAFNHAKNTRKDTDWTKYLQRTTTNL